MHTANGGETAKANNRLHDILAPLAIMRRGVKPMTE